MSNGKHEQLRRLKRFQKLLCSIYPYIENDTFSDDAQKVSDWLGDVIDLVSAPDRITEVGSRAGYQNGEPNKIAREFVDIMTAMAFEKKFEQENARVVTEWARKIADATSHRTNHDVVGTGEITGDIEKYIYGGKRND